MDMGRRATPVLAFVVFLVAAAVYLVTLTPTVPFWDSGEFIAVSQILGIPHPPGTPFYVLLGRIAALVPWASVAQRVNALSAIAAALAVMITYLVGYRLVRHILLGGRASLGAESEPAGAAAGESGVWIAHLGGVMAALMIAFSDSFWENSIEAEVYSLMSLAQILVLWLGLRGWEEHERRPTAGLLLLAVYVMWLSVGLHLGVGIMGLPLLILVALVDRRMAVVFAMPFLSAMLVTMGLERMAGAVLLLSTVTFLVYAAQKRLHGGVAAVSAIGALYGMSIAFGDAPFNWTSALVAAASVLVPLALLARRTVEGRIIALALALMVIGYSTHLYLPIRASQHPAINEGAPADWDSLRDLLERKQYGQMNMMVRRAPWSVQLDKEFWRYFGRQWPVLPIQDRHWASLLPIALGLIGGMWQARRDRYGFLATGAFLGLTTAGLILFLNFSDREVRERDYFFQSGYHAFALWIGVGCAWLVLYVREAFARSPQRRWATLAAAILLLALPLVMLKVLWFTHDRRGNYVAQDYAYNMLAPLAPNSFVFTNGDNDTFPLWYIQEVEGFRKDVRIVNMSLLNTDWYIRQLRDQEPKVPIRLDDATVRLLGGGAVQDDQGRIIYTNEYMVQHIMQANRREDGSWIKQPYFAVTVPDHVGLDPYFTLEGLVQRVNPDSTGPDIDVEATREALYETFRYRGLFSADGSWDPTVYKDENAETLSRNYMAAHVSLALHHRRQGQLDLAVVEMERVARMFPDFTDAIVQLGEFYIQQGDTTKAMNLFASLVQRDPTHLEARYYYGVSLLYRGRVDDAVSQFDQALALNPEFGMGYLAAYQSLWESGQRERALTYLQRWLDRHPDDAQARQLYDIQRRALGGSAPEPLLPRPIGR
jgi:hypothetical protein